MAVRKGSAFFSGKPFDAKRGKAKKEEREQTRSKTRPCLEGPRPHKALYSTAGRTSFLSFLLLFWPLSSLLPPAPPPPWRGRTSKQGRILRGPLLPLRQLGRFRSQAKTLKAMGFLSQGQTAQLLSTGGQVRERRSSASVWEKKGKCGKRKEV